MTRIRVQPLRRQGEEERPKLTFPTPHSIGPRTFLTEPEIPSTGLRVPRSEAAFEASQDKFRYWETWVERS